MTGTELLDHIKQYYKEIAENQIDLEHYRDVDTSINSNWKEIADLGDTFIYTTGPLKDGNQYMMINECGIQTIYQKIK